MAQQCDAAVVVIGEPAYMHSPALGCKHPRNNPSQQDLLESIVQTGTPMVVVVMMGRPYILTWCAENAAAILVAYYPGTQGAIAIADVLFGDYNPKANCRFKYPHYGAGASSEKRHPLRYR